MRRMLIRSFEQKKPVEIVYLSNDGTITQRMVWITSLTETTMTGYCSLRKQTRTFSIDRILSARMLPLRKNRNNNAG
ncbi:WYL domain-containing protein [Pseudalkalibacillus sp. R45]|uniref:WYL domain-containing protein n=1 Tax=Pseudalkalibacillus sp. R45 TaxID=3457433 RepID=UPI003FCD640D